MLRRLWLSRSPNRGYLNVYGILHWSVSHFLPLGAQKKEALFCIFYYLFVIFESGWSVSETEKCKLVNYCDTFLKMFKLWFK